MRGAGQGFCYNFGRGLGAFFPVLVGVVSALSGSAQRSAFSPRIAYAIVILAALALPETRGRELRAD